MGCKCSAGLCKRTKPAHTLVYMLQKSLQHVAMTGFSQWVQPISVWKCMSPYYSWAVVA